MTSEHAVPKTIEPTDASGHTRDGEHRTDEGDISLLDLLIVIVERKRTVFKITAIFAVLAIVISLILPKSYTATVTLLPPQESGSMASALMSQLSNLGGMASSLAGGSLGLKNQNDRYVAMLKSQTVEDAMVTKYGLMQEYHRHYLSDARKSFASHVTVDGDGKDGLIHISVEDHNAERAAELANGYVDQFRDLSQHLAFTEASQRRLFFQQEMEHAKDNLANAEVALEQTELKTGVIQPDSQARELIETAASLRAQIAAHEVQIQGMQTYATGENSQLVLAQEELTGLRAQLAKLGGSESTGDNELLIPKGEVPKAGLEYVRRLRDVKYYETIFEILARQFELAKLDEAKEGAIIQVVDPAIVPDRRSFPKRALIVIGATIFGVLIGSFAVLLQAAMQRFRRDPETDEKLMQLKRAWSLRSRRSH